MNQHEIDAVIRSSSPTTRERLRTALSNYQSILTSRIASIKELAVKEEVLRAQCGFGKLTPSQRKPPSGVSKTNTNLRRAGALVPQPAGAQQDNFKLVGTPSRQRVGTPRISSALLQQHEHRNAPAADTSYSLRESSPSPAKTQHNDECHHVDLHTENTAARREHLSDIDDTRPTSFADAEKELRSLFQRQRSTQKQRSRREASLEGSLIRGDGGQRNGSILNGSILSMSSSSSTAMPGGGAALTASDQLKRLRARNTMLRSKVAAVMEASRTQVDPQASEMLAVVDDPSLCLCAACLQWSTTSVEAALPKAFDLAHDIVSRCSGSQMYQRHTTSLTSEDDDDTKRLRRDVAGLERDKILLRLRRVELLASRLHHQRLLWHSSTTAGIRLAELPLSSTSTATTKELHHDDDVVMGRPIPSSMDILSALEDAHSAHGAYQRLVECERTVAALRERLQNSLPLLSALSVLSELQWCAEEAHRETSFLH